MRLPGEQGDTVICSHAPQHTDTRQLVWEQLSVILLQLIDFVLIVRRYAVHRLRGWEVKSGSEFHSFKWCKALEIESTPMREKSHFQPSICAFKEGISRGCGCRREQPGDTGCTSWRPGSLAGRNNHEESAPRPVRALTTTPAACRRPPCTPCRLYPAEKSRANVSLNVLPAVKR